MNRKTYERMKRSRLGHLGFLGLNFMNLFRCVVSALGFTYRSRFDQRGAIEHVLVPDDVSDRGHSHGGTGVARIRLRGSIDLRGGRRIVSEMLSSAQFDNGTVPSFEAEKLVETYGEHPDGVNSKLVQITESHGGRCFCGD
jgi:hypothetical protein